MPTELSGIGATPLSGVGTAVWYDGSVELPDRPDPDAVDPDEQRRRFEAARERARDQLADERERAAERIGESEAEIFDAHVQFLDDPRIVEGVEAAIDEGLPAPHAVDRAYADAVEELEAAGGRVAERADDLRDLRDRLVSILTGADAGPGTLPEGAVVLAERLAPSDTAGLDPDAVAGIATVTGGRTAHAAIVARSLGIPAVVGVGEELRSVDPGATVVVDGAAGTVIVDPDAETRERAAADEDVEIVRRRVTTADGRAIEVAANLGTREELDGALERGSDGVGLFRTEFLFQNRDHPPDEDEQYEVYSEVRSAFPDDRVIVRTLDVGGDKPLPYLDLPDERDPFLGLRGIRRSLGPDADLFEEQLRALLRAAAGDEGGDLAVMFPMVATVEELSAALERVDAVADDLADEGEEYARPELGVMVETPSAAFIADRLAERVSFLSLGTNDLAQYVMAAARENEAVGDLHAPTHPAVLRAIDRTVTAGHGADAWVGMCGEMAGDPRFTELLVGLGLDELSMGPVTVPRVKRAVEATDAAAAERLAERAMAAQTRAEVEALLDDGAGE